MTLCASAQNTFFGAKLQSTFERFTDRARKVLVLAQEEARLLNHSFIGTEHILLGLIDEGEGLAAQALAGLGVTLEGVRAGVRERIELSGTAQTGSRPFTPRAKKVMELSLREALQLGHKYICTEHLLLGIVREGEGLAAQVLVSLGADLPVVREQVMLMLQGYQGFTVEQRATSRVTNPRVPMRDLGQITSVERVAKEWTARVVRDGRTPTDYEAAYDDLAELMAVHGIELDDLEPGQLVVNSVDTNEGPGLALSFSYRVEDEPDMPAEDESGGES